MEHRRDLELLLLDGLPDDERVHVEEAILGESRTKLARLRTADPALIKQPGAEVGDDPAS